MNHYILWLGCYLLGSLPTGVLIARVQKVNLREHGSGNIGATNAARVLGEKAGLLTLLGDFSKGLLAVYIANVLFNNASVTAFAGLFVFLGHLFSVFLKFKGGKGVATGLGIFMYLMPLPTLMAMVIFALALKVSTYVSVASILSSLCLPIMALVFKSPEPTFMVSVVIALLIVCKHYENIIRLMAGKEAPFKKK
jgi:glycerol-3-phosphate acyltransferase PlsY